MLDQARLIAFVPTADPDRARSFYQSTLGLALIHEDPFAIVFAVGETTLRVTKVGPFTPAPFTILGWQVADIESKIRALMARDVLFERYDSLDQDPLGIWTAPGGSRVAWFKDPDGNVLSLSAADR